MKENFTQPLSVVICAKNEAQNLQHNLPAILKQDYPDFEVIVVNDLSTDTTTDILTNLQQQYDHLKVVTISEPEPSLKGKRNALQKGIAAANNAYIILTDADCQPTSHQWLQLMSQPFAQGKDISIGYSPYTKAGGLLNWAIQYETFITGLQYLSFAIAGLPYMGVGRNMGYAKQVFEQSKVFQNTGNIHSGDDDLVVNEWATKKNTSVVINQDAFTYSMPKTTWNDWWRQKRRHSNTGWYYRNSTKWLLAPFSISLVLITFGLLVLVFSGYNLKLVLLLYVSKVIIQMLIFTAVGIRLKQPLMGLFAPIGDFMISLLLCSLGILSMVKVKEW